MEELGLNVEALIFASETGISKEELLDVLGQIDDSDISAETVAEALELIRKKYDSPESILELVFVNNTFQFLTKPRFHPAVSRLLSQRSKKKLSQAALETLAIVAYRQPVTKLEIEHIRGVNCDYSIQRLLEKSLIQIQGKADSAGRPLLYGTSRALLDYLGLNSISEIPQLKDITSSDNSIGTVSS